MNYKESLQEIKTIVDQKYKELKESELQKSDQELDFENWISTLRFKIHIIEAELKEKI